MNRLLRSRRIGATVTIALGFLVASAAPVMASPALADIGCTDYGPVVDAPKGVIPRDDAIRPRQDPLAAWLAANPDQADAATSAAPVVIDVVFHVISKDDTPEGGNIPDAQIAAQIDVMNSGFAGSGFQFRLTETTRTVEPSLFNMFYTQGGEPRFFRGSHKEIRMKKALYSGDSETLNLYSSSLGKRLLGWAYLPWDFDPEIGNPLPRFYDGVVLDYRSLPGGAYTNYSEGDTATHEVGHWLGLYHTFDNGCSEPGDFVADTPYEASPAFGCPVGRDTCDQAGLDPINNFMDYTYDSCMFEFTDGQESRMQDTWDVFRAIG